MIYQQNGYSIFDSFQISFFLNSHPLTVTWNKGIDRILSSNANTRMLRLSNVKKSDEGSYVCDATVKQRVYNVKVIGKNAFCFDQLWLVSKRSITFEIGFLAYIGTFEECNERIPHHNQKTHLKTRSETRSRRNPSRLLEIRPEKTVYLV